jgi:hypothetical protein
MYISPYILWQFILTLAQAGLVAGCKVVAHRKVRGEVIFNRANVDWHRYSMSTLLRCSFKAAGLPVNLWN